MRIAIGCFAQESHSFSPVPGSWQHFGPQEVQRGPAMFEGLSGARIELSGALQVARQPEIELLPLLAARASSSAGPMLDEVFQTLRDELLAALQASMPLDGVLLILHGAMLTQSCPDASGALLEAARAIIGPQVPLVASLDLHANVTRRMAAQASALVGYHTAPHVDMYETGQRAMRLLVDSVAGRVRPRMAWRYLPMILPAENGCTTHGPLAEVMTRAEAISRQPGILDVSVFSVQPWLDVPEVGCSVVVVGDGEAQRVGQAAESLADEFWRRRTAFEVSLVPTAQAIRRALDSARHPFVLADSADAPSSGAPGDSTVVLSELLRADPQRDCLLNIVDPPAVAAMLQAGVGQQVTLRLGAGFSQSFYQPLEVTGYVQLLSDGDFVHKGPGFRGVVSHRGRTGVLRIGRIYLVVMERPVIQWDPELYRSLGLEPADAQIVVVKSPAAFRAAYEPLAAEILILDAPGVCSPNLRSLPFRRVRRPLYPLDEIEDWRQHMEAYP